MTTISTNQNPTHNDNQFWIGLFLGGLMGALMIVLLGTEKGRKLAKKLQDEGLDLWEGAKDQAAEKKEALVERLGDELESLEEKGQNLVNKGQQLISQGRALESQLVHKVTTAKEELADKAVKSADAALAHIEALQERGRQTTAELRKQLFKNIPKK